ncbi:MAG: TraR/DksA C4-type zinc finger protein [Candidatus Spechtbacterales bacterium]
MTLLQQELDKLRAMLEERKGRIETELSSIAKRDDKPKGDWDSTYPIFDTVFNLEEASDEVEEYVNRLPVEQSLEVSLKAITAALTRMNEGTYGACGNCAKDIPLKRLDAMPETQLCMDCSNSAGRRKTA